MAQEQLMNKDGAFHVYLFIHFRLRMKTLSTNITVVPFQRGVPLWPLIRINKFICYDKQERTYIS